MPAIRAAESFPMRHLTDINDSLKEVISILASQLDQKTAVLQANSDFRSDHATNFSSVSAEASRQNERGHHSC